MFMNLFVVISKSLFFPPISKDTFAWQIISFGSSLLSAPEIHYTFLAFKVSDGRTSMSLPCSCCKSIAAFHIVSLSVVLRF